MVEATGFEPTTFWSLTKRATKLRYASIPVFFVNGQTCGQTTYNGIFYSVYTT